MQGDYAGIGRPPDVERERLGHLAERLNPGTQRRMRDLGIGPGWRCLEIGAAEGSMTRWMAEQVGPTGHVVAADIEVRFLADLDLPNVEVRELDLRRDPLEPDHYDLAYCRTLLLHLSEPADALGRMAAALRPGGWLLAQDPDVGSTSAADPDHPDAAEFERLNDVIYAWLRREGVFDATFGRNLVRLLREIGLEEVDTRGSVEIVRGGSPAIASYKQTMEAMAPLLVSKGAVSRDEMRFLLARHDDPGFDQVSEIQFVAWGRKPA